MSWTVGVAGKPSEIEDKLRRAFGPRSAEGDGISNLVGNAVAGVPDTTDQGDSVGERTVVVESSGHVDRYAASFALTVRTYTTYVKKAPELAGSFDGVGE